MRENEIRSSITNKINQGQLKSLLYDEFKKEISDDALRNILASRPSYELWKKYKKAHLVLSIIWGFYMLLELLGIFDLMVIFDIKIFISLILSLYVTVNIWKFDGRFFLPGIIWFSFTIVRSFSELDTLYLYDTDFKFVLIFLILYGLILAVGIYLMFYIRKNVFDYMKWFKPILNHEGKIQFE